MNRLSTALIVLAAIALAVFVGTTSRWRFSSERLNTVGAPLFRFDPAEIDGIKIKNGDTTTTLRQVGEGWRVFSDIDDDASAEAIAALMHSALTSPILDRIDASEVQDDKRLTTYGVGKSSLQIDFLGDRPGTLLFGKNSPDYSRTYVSFKDSNTVYLIPKQFTDFVSTQPETFRERRLLTLDPSTIDQLVIRKGPSIIELKRMGGTWEILKPLRDHASVDAIQRILDTLSNARIESFTQKKTTPHQPWEAIDVEGSIEINSLAADAPIVLTFTKPDTQGARTVDLLPRNIAGKMPVNFPDILSIDLDSLRDRTLLHLNPDMIDIVRIKIPRSELVIERENDAWQPAALSVDSLIESLTTTQVASYEPATPTDVERYGLATPTHEITFSALLTENTPEALAGEHPVVALSIGSPQPDGMLPILVSGSPEIRFVPIDFLECLGGL
jgi:hypothetical protein